MHQLELHYMHMCMSHIFALCQTKCDYETCEHLLYYGSEVSCTKAQPVQLTTYIQLLIANGLALHASY